jgi:hypothetical protein
MTATLTPKVREVETTRPVVAVEELEVGSLEDVDRIRAPAAIALAGAVRVTRV